MAEDLKETEKNKQNPIKRLFQSIWPGTPEAELQTGERVREDSPAGVSGNAEAPLEEAGASMRKETEWPGAAMWGRPAEDPNDENRLRAAGNALYELYTRRRGLPVVVDEAATFHLSSFMEGNKLPDEEKRNWLKSMERDARAVLQKGKNAEEEPVDAEVLVRVTKDRMQAWLFLFPPTYGGREPDYTMAMQALNEAGVKYGIDEGLVLDICDGRRYFTLLKVADGVPPEDGTDGEIVDHFPRELEIQLKVRDDNTIDYKDLGWLKTVRAGDVVCDVIPPIPATAGHNVRGEEIRGRDGRKASPPKGQGTKLSEEETALLAETDGVLSFQQGRFRVDPLLIIQGNVETATGNLSVVGDLLVHGDIREGFTVEATGNITVQGIIEGAEVVSGGNIQVGRGTNGNSHGVLRAKGDVLCKYIENATVSAGGHIVCDTIINSTVSSDSTINVTTGRGVIIGGSVAALERIDAKNVGNQSNRNINITLGSTASFLHDKEEVEQKQRVTASEVEELEKNIRFLEAGADSQNEQMAKTVEEMKFRLSVLKVQLAGLDRRIELFQRKQADNAACRLKAEIIYPPAQVTIGGFSKNIRQIAFNSTVYLSEGEVRVASI